MYCWIYHYKYSNYDNELHRSLNYILKLLWFYSVIFITGKQRDKLWQVRKAWTKLNIEQSSKYNLFLFNSASIQIHEFV